MRATYGNNEADALLGQPQTQLVLRTPEEGTAKWLEGQLGSSEIERAGESQQMGASSQRDGVSTPSRPFPRRLRWTSKPLAESRRRAAAKFRIKRGPDATANPPASTA